MRRRPGSLLLAPAAAAALGLVSCAAGPGSASVTPATGTPASAPTEPAIEPPASSDGSHVDRDDGVLRIGLLLPQTGAGADIGIPANNAAEFAIRRINDTTMFHGEPVELVKADEGADAESASAAIDELLAQGVDAVVGPASSTVAVQVLGQLTEAGVLTCSPTASTMMLDLHPDRNGLFFRTIPSESGQMAAIAYSANREGVSNVVVLYRDDEYGQGLRRAAARNLESWRLNITDEIPLSTTDTEFDDEIARVATDSPESTIIVLSDGIQGMQVMDAIARNVEVLGGDDLPRVMVNEAITAADPSVYASWPQALIDNWVRYAPVAGVPAAPAPVVEPTPTGADSSPPTTEADPDATIPEGPCALNTVDCINLIVLSAITKDTDDPTLIAQQMPLTADGGVPCDTFNHCIARLDEGREIDYNGVNTTNVVKPFTATGDPGRTTVMTYVIDPGLIVEVTYGTVTSGTG